MAIFGSKWFIFIFIVVLFFIILLMIGTKSVSTQVQIKASPKNVWAALSNTDNVKQWNKVLIPIKGELKEGNVINYDFYQEENGKPSNMNATVKEIVDQKMINQQGGLPLILTFNHKYIIESTSFSTTVKIHEEYKGIMVPFWDPSPVEKAYSRLLHQLKSFIENE
ncbi:SRPBCC domain-containing protein [Flammeovirga sp. OC4]|uniref:SRPBCC domain-containing protein n=1 Tax=Flammeovirga sp. OC4 TaxID=1382345 RepID=UPI0005C498D8|nr:SRPBCC domain-containing protein [Flammeovirga sp. OC4]